MPDAVTTALARVVAELPGGGEGQQQMATAVHQGIAERKHVAVQAGTGTGKTRAYLVPAILSGRRTFVATATKALHHEGHPEGRHLREAEPHQGRFRVDRPSARCLLRRR